MTNDELLIDISSKVAAIQVTVENIKEDIVVNKNDSIAVTKKLEEYFEYIKNRQDSIKRELNSRIDAHESRITSIEQGKSRSILRWWDWCKDKLIAAVLITIAILLYKWLELPSPPKF